MQEFGFEFSAMASRNEIRLMAPDEATARAWAQAAIDEVRRIEAKYSRYRDDSAVSRINRAAGADAVTVDEETAALLDFAAQLHALSDGLFDLTSGVLRRAWNFKAQRVPTQDELDALLPLVGWSQVHWQRPQLRLPRAGMELDFGGIGKEYAADRAAGVLTAMGARSGFVNLGGDVRGLARIFHQGRGSCADAGASDVEREGRSPMPIGIGEHLSATAPHMRRANPRSPDDPIWIADSCHEAVCSERGKTHQRGRPDEISGLGAPLDGGAWSIAIQHPRDATQRIGALELSTGAVATSGDYERFFEADGQRYCHILNPFTGWPTVHWQSVSVAAPLCVVAGACSTMAMLMPRDQALDFLAQQGLNALLVDLQGQVVSVPQLADNAA